ncbi:hypothetical protein [Parabacteroides provencensis]|uniref:hypothetical protein n=1 Tax=Parabacteroides provencensis TaxID=1944636 RepID=UPI00117DA756|nr:hypothetical protein [Parabacteroides provencensis]
MSKQHHIINVTPPEYQQVHESMTFGNYTCPVCNGRGSFIPEQVAHNHWQSKTCDYCDGTGKVKADVQISWKPDYSDR